MKAQHVIPFFACAALLVAGYAAPGFAQEQAVQCLQQAQLGVRPGAWEAITNVIRSLSLANAATTSQSRLIRLKTEIINLENWKRTVIEIVEAHISGASGGAAVSNNLRLSNIPNVLGQIDAITTELNSLADNGDLFAAENSFKELKVNLDMKRTITLCDLAGLAASPTPDRLLMTTLVGKLKDELKAISAAEDALGNYIKETGK